MTEPNTASSSRRSLLLLMTPSSRGSPPASAHSLALPLLLGLGPPLCFSPSPSESQPTPRVPEHQVLHLYSRCSLGPTTEIPASYWTSVLGCLMGTAHSTFSKRTPCGVFPSQNLFFPGFLYSKRHSQVPTSSELEPKPRNFMLILLFPNEQCITKSCR